MLQQTHRFLIGHWHGHVALLPTLVVSVLGLRLLLSWLTRMKPLDWPLSAFVAATLFSAAILLWQVTGLVRALRRRRDGLGLAAGAAGVAVAALLFLNTELDSHAARATDSGGLSLIVPRPIQPLPVAGTTVTLSGWLDWPLYARFCTTLHRHPGLTTVALSSNGGLVPVARALAARIGEAGFDTQATGLCASACTLVFVAGNSHSLGPDGALGFHGYALRRHDPLQSLAEEEQRDRDWLAARGIDPGFIDRIFATDPDTLWRPDAATLRAAGVLRERPPRTGLSGPPNCGDTGDHAASP